MVLELTFQRATVHPVHDTKRLEDGKDLNDALLDFFVKLGQHLIPEKGKAPPVAYLGSHFYDVLRKGGVKDGKDGHKNVANWAKRRLGKDGLFSSDIGALAIPVNEVLHNVTYDSTQETSEKHWWLALLLNPGAASTSSDDRDLSLLCLDSFVRADMRYNPPMRALKGGKLASYPVEVKHLSRIGFNIKVYFSAEGDGTAGGLPEPRKSRVKAGGREFPNTEMDLKARDFGGDGRPGRLEGSLGFRLDRRGAAKTVGQYNLEFGDGSENYEPPLKLRMGDKPTTFQQQVAKFLGGYLEKEQELHSKGKDRHNGSGGTAVATSVEDSICLPGVPQQETSHDCGFFIMEMILRCLQLTPKALRELATASSVEIAMLPWPSQQQILRRKAMLREAVEALFSTARRLGTGNVEDMFKAEPKLREQIRSFLTEGGHNFTHGFERWAAGDWDLSPSPSRSRSRGKSKKTAKRAKARSSSSSGSGRKRRRRGSSEDSSRAGKKRRRRSPSRSSSGSDRRRSRSSSASDQGKKVDNKSAQPSFTQEEIAVLGIGALKNLCIQRGVLPAVVVERSDLLNALAPFCVAPKAPPPGATGAKKEFRRSDLVKMSVKDLKALCIQKMCLPPPPLEKDDLVKALMPHALPG